MMVCQPGMKWDKDWKMIMMNLPSVIHNHYSNLKLSTIHTSKYRCVYNLFKKYSPINQSMCLEDWWFSESQLR